MEYKDHGGKQKNSQPWILLTVVDMAALEHGHTAFRETASTNSTTLQLASWLL